MLEYIKDIRACFLTRLKTGFHLDEILLMDERHAKEAQLIGKVRNNFFKYSKGFEDFLKEDHLTSIQLLEMAKQETKKSKQKLEIINRLKNELKKVETEILETEEQWRKFRMFQKFLYLTAPQDWRKAHDPDYGKSSSEETVSDPCLFDR